MSFTKPKGTYDVLPNEVYRWHYIEEIVRSLAHTHRFKEIRTPMFESSEVYHRSAGETSDVVSKETYDFIDRGDRPMTLRPEGTAGAVRSFIENKLHATPGVTKLFYIGPMFRYERQQKGRYRQHMQFGVEAFGSPSPMQDVEVIALACAVIERLGLNNNVRVKLNSLGSADSRTAYREALLAHFQTAKASLCSDCQIRYEKNPLRILDCKADADKEIMKSVPAIIDHLTAEDALYFDKVKAGLDAIGIAYEYDANLVRGFDYYTHTIFEVQADIPGFGAQTTLCGGGRYDGLVAMLGGPETPGVGFGMGLERMLLALEAVEAKIEKKDTIDLFLLPMGDAGEKLTAKILKDVRLDDLVADADFSSRKLGARFKLADDLKAKFVIVIGDDEVDTGVVSIKRLADGQTENVNLNELSHYVKANG